ncbi:unnamed protein product [Closterium sp. NIES-53]
MKLSSSTLPHPPPPVTSSWTVEPLTLSFVMLVHCALSPHPPLSLVLKAAFLSPVTTLPPFLVLSIPQVLSPVSTFPPYALTSSPKGRLLSRIPLCPRSRLYTLRLPRPPTCQVASPSLLPPPPLPPTNPPLPPRPRDSDCSCRSLSHPTILLHHRLGHPKFATLRSSVSSGLLHGPPSSLPPLPKSPAPPPALSAFIASSSSSRTGAPPPLLHNHLIFRYSFVSLLRTKADAPAAIIAWLERANTHFGRPVRRLHSDGGGEFLNNQVSSYCQSRGIL